jgi:hypothetical protein
MSGELISGSEYFELLATDLEKSSAKFIAKNIQTIDKHLYPKNEDSQILL